MTQNRNYSSTAQPTTLTASITPTTTSLTILSSVGFPPTPFIAAVDYNTSSEELVLVTTAVGTSWTVTRAFDTTSATSHSSGAGVRHVSAAIDFNEAGAHIGATTNVHGLAIGSAVVGTTDTQTLLNKSLTAPGITGTVSGGATYTNTTHTPLSTSTVGLVVQGLASQTGDLQQWQTSTGTPLAKISSNGTPTWPTTYLQSAYVEDTTTRTTTSTTYADVSLLSTTVSVPTSGKVHVTAHIRHGLTAANVYGFSTINITGSVSGSLRASNDLNSIQTGYPTIMADGSGELTFIVTSANIGETLTIKWQHHIASAGPTYNLYYRNISAIPLVG